MKRIVLLILMLLPQLAFSQIISHRNIVPGGYNFLVYTPEDRQVSDTSKIPAVVFLHGRSLCGTDLNKVRKYGCLDALTYGRKINAVIIAPQNPGGSWKPSRIMKVLEWAEKHYPVDPSRVYVVGMSLGGYGTIDFAGTYPDKVAAAMALCGGGTIKDYSGLLKVPLWIIHGKSDRQVPWTASQKVVDAMAAIDTTRLLRYDLLPGIDHGGLARCFYVKNTYDWLFCHSLNDPVRTVNRDYSMTVADLNNAYGDLHGGRRSYTVLPYSAGGGSDDSLPSPSAAPAASMPDASNYAVSAGSANAGPDYSGSATSSSEEKVPDYIFPGARNKGVQNSAPQNTAGHIAVESQVAQNQAAKPQAGGSQYHKVIKGDTLFAISRSSGVSVDSLCRLNGIGRDAVLSIGQKIKIQ